MDHDALIDCAFAPIARDGATNIEVACELRLGLSNLAASDHPEVQTAARQTAARALRYAQAGGLAEEEVEILQEIGV